MCLNILHYLLNSIKDWGDWEAFQERLVLNPRVAFCGSWFGSANCLPWK